MQERIVSARFPRDSPAIDAAFPDMRHQSPIAGAQVFVREAGDPRNAKLLHNLPKAKLHLLDTGHFQSRLGSSRDVRFAA